MELKNYQKDVIRDLSRFLTLMTETGSAARAYKSLWEEKNVIVGANGLPPYHYNLAGFVPDVCFKVPTGGGKTFLAANAIKTIFDAMPVLTVRAVVWLVPSDAILRQTFAALGNPDHPYRRKIDVDFGGAVEVYSKEQLLTGQNFNPSAVADQLSIFVLSYDSFRTSKKEGRKAYQENGNLATFPRYMQDKSVLLPDTDETALIQVIRSLNPVVIVDESHHATSELSVKMLENFNPCFVLDLTATPKSKSNIISFVDAAQLKAANMVKLPVIVYNRKSQSDVYADAISLRCKLEAQATADQKTTGRYIRPIVLFQAQPRVGAESTTYDKIKATLIDAGIPEQEIAIKTGDKDELKNVDLLSSDCPIRYIITVNALKEGWDCPFAYILATVANRTSSVDVEQILGRVLRLPYTARNSSNVLNISYVITSSADFGRTLDKVVSGLNQAGFSNKDYRARDYAAEELAEEKEPDAPQGTPVQTPVQTAIQTESPSQEQPDDIPEVDSSAIRRRIEKSMSAGQNPTAPTFENDDMITTALSQNDEYEKQMQSSTDTAIDLAPTEVRDKMNSFRMNEAFAQEASSLVFPQFMLKVGLSFFSSGGYPLLQLDYLEEGFTLNDKDVQIDFSTMDIEMARVDTDDSTDTAPKVWQITGTDSAYFKQWFNAQPSHIRLAHCKGLIRKKIGKINSINERELDAYIDRIIGTMSEDQLSDMEQSVYPYAVKIENKVKALLAAHRVKTFELWLEQGRIVCQPNYSLPPIISPTSFTSTYPKSLYSAEEDMNEYERKVVWAISSLPNIKWWHRNISRLGFQINGALHAYPDIIAMTHSGMILMIETKGDHLDNDESKAKAKLGHQWANLAGSQYKYYMVFEHKSPDYSGAYSYDRFMEIIKGV